MHSASLNMFHLKVSCSWSFLYYHNPSRVTTPPQLLICAMMSDEFCAMQDFRQLISVYAPQAVERAPEILPHYHHDKNLSDLRSRSGFVMNLSCPRRFGSRYLLGGWNLQSIVAYVLVLSLIVVYKPWSSSVSLGYSSVEGTYSNPDLVSWRGGVCASFQTIGQRCAWEICTNLMAMGLNSCAIIAHGGEILLYVPCDDAW